jgi:large subunit ribosomal protein L22
MEVKAIAKYVRVQPRKVRIIADEVRGKNAMHVASLLRYHTSKSAKALRKVLISAMANAQENNNLSVEGLKIAAITVDEGPRLKRMQARAMGRGNRIVKKTSHITVVVEDAPIEKAVKPHGTKAKPRPTFAAPTKGKKGGAAKATKKEEENIAAAAQPVDETTDTDAEAVTAAAPEEATPVTESEAPEEAGSEAPLAEPEATTPEAEVAEEGAEKE